MPIQFFTRASLRRIDLRRMIILAVVAVVAIAGVVFGALELQKSMLRDEATERASMVAALKVRQIESLLDAQRSLAVALTHGTITVLKIEDWIRAGSTTKEIQQQVLNRLLAVQRDNHYSEVTVIQPNGEILLSAGGHSSIVSSEDRAALVIAHQTGKVQFTSIHLDPDSPEAVPILGVVAPMIAIRPDGREQVVAYLLMHLLPARMLYPWLGDFPVPTETAEVLLGERQGDRVIFLNELRHRHGMAFRYSIPISDSRVLAVQVALGKRGTLEGIDYRGAAVLGEGRQISGTNWLLIAKQDRSEVYAPLFRRTLVTAGLGSVFLMTIVCAVFLWLRMRGHITRRENEFRFRMLFDSMADAILVTGEDGKFVEANQIALDRLGYTRQELLRLGPVDINPPEDSTVVRLRMARVLQ